jgi:hypothetical protein
MNCLRASPVIPAACVFSSSCRIATFSRTITIPSVPIEFLRKSE